MDYQKEINDLYLHGHIPRELTGFDYWICYKNPDKNIFVAPYDGAIIKEENVEKKLLVSEYEKLISDNRLGELLMICVDEVSAKMSNHSPHPIDGGKRTIPKFKRFIFENRLSKLLSSDTFVTLIDPVAGFPFQLSIETVGNNVIICVSVHLILERGY